MTERSVPCTLSKTNFALSCILISGWLAMVWTRSIVNKTNPSTQFKTQIFKFFTEVLIQSNLKSSAKNENRYLTVEGDERQK